MDYRTALEWIARPVAAVDFPRSLDSMHRLLAVLRLGSLPFPVIIVAGSVGKGTTCHQLATLLQSTAARIGLYTSPHLHVYRERIQINGQMISPTEFVECVQVLQQAATITGDSFSTFEWITALALWWFQQQSIDLAILEIGLGGRWDAVNAVPYQLGLITPIELEHVAMLGGSLQTIAYHKAGIIHPASHTISVSQTSVVADILEQEAQFQHAILEFSADPIRTAAAFMLEHGWITSSLSPTTVLTSILPARLEPIAQAGRTVWIDGAHTVRSMQRLVQHLPAQPYTVLLGMLADKQVGEVVALLDQPGWRWIITTLPGERALPPSALLERYRPRHAATQSVPLCVEAWDVFIQSTGDLLVTGSLRLAALGREGLGLLSEHMRDEAEMTRQVFAGEGYRARRIGK
jgi:dihydrofolate synthase/folylpolyglutamate synthase